MQLDILKESSNTNCEALCWFETIGDVTNVYSLYFYKQEEILPAWMEVMDAYPIYFCIQVADGFEDGLEECCYKHGIDFYIRRQFANADIYGVVIKNKQQFIYLFPFVELIKTMEDIVLWSTKKDCFTVDEKKKTDGILDFPINVHFDKDTTVFNFCMCGLNLMVLTNEPIFESFATIKKSLPDFVDMTISEYAEND